MNLRGEQAGNAGKTPRQRAGMANFRDERGPWHLQNLSNSNRKDRVPWPFNRYGNQHKSTSYFLCAGDPGNDPALGALRLGKSDTLKGAKSGINFAFFRVDSRLSF